MAKKRKQILTKEVTEIGMAVAALIVGGYVIYIIGSQFPLPGIKYTIMAPYLSLVIAFVLTYFKGQYAVLIVNAVFAMIMTMINPYMGISIFIVGLLTFLVQKLLPQRWRFYVHTVAALYSGFVVGVALMVSKLFIGTVFFQKITYPYMVALMLFAVMAGVFGAYFGVIIGRRVKRNV